MSENNITANIEVSQADITIITRALLHLPDETFDQLSPEIGLRLLMAAGEIGRIMKGGKREISNGERWQEMCRQIDSGEFPPTVVVDALNMGAGALEMYIDKNIEQQQERRRREMKKLIDQSGDSNG